jgi:hypothetical protein
MKKRGDETADRAWDRMVERLDGTDADARELTRAEEMLAGGEDAPVSGEWIQKTVARVTASSSSVPKLPSLRWLRPLYRLAAVLLAAILLTAAGFWVLSDTGRPSESERTTLEQAVEVLMGGTATIDEKRAALSIVYEVTDGCVVALLGVRHERGAPSDLVDLAARQLEHLRDVRKAGEGVKPDVQAAVSRAHETMTAAIILAGDPLQLPAVRHASLLTVGGLAESGILIIQTAAFSEPGLSLEKGIYFQRLDSRLK